MNNTILTGQAVLSHLDAQRNQEIKSLQANPIRSAAENLSFDSRDAERASVTLAAAKIAGQVTIANKIHALLNPKAQPEIDTYA